MKKRLAFLLVLCLTASLLCGCFSFRSADGEKTETDAPARTTAADSTSISTVGGVDTGDVTVSVSSEAVPTVPATETPTETTQQTRSPSPIPGDGDYVPAVYMYHLIMEEPFSEYDGLFVRPSEFAAQLDALNEMGASYLFADEYKTTDGPSAVITFDDGYEDNYTTMFPILKEKGARATIFIISGWVGGEGYLTEAQIKEMADSGLVRFGCHTVSHADLSNLDEDGIRSQMLDANAAIGAMTGRAVTSIAYPAGGYNDTVTRVAREIYNFAYTTDSPATHTSFDAVTIPRYRVTRGQGAEIIRSTMN